MNVSDLVIPIFFYPHRGFQVHSYIIKGVFTVFDYDLLNLVNFMSSLK